MVTVELGVQPVLSYAMAHNGSPILTILRLTNDGAALDDLEVVVEVRDGDGVLSRPCSVVVDLPAGTPAAPATQAVDPDSLDLRLDADAMWQLTDERPATVRAGVVHAGATLTETGRPVQLLPGAHWRNEPRGLAFELLASFVMPNDPAVNRLLAEASELLRQRTGSPALEGYQSGPERVDEIVGAIWDATAARQVTYVQPPASWGAGGQKVRTPTIVLEDRVGTCLDLTVVLAAALEQAGVRPLLWLTAGHAFAGYWRDEAALDAIYHPGADEVANAVDLGRIRLLETTAVTSGHEVATGPATLDDAHRLALARLADPREVEAVVDVHVARQHHVLPLPARRPVAGGGGRVEVVEYRPAAHARPALVLGSRQAVPAADPSVSAPARVQQWKNALLDLSLRNRLINYTPRSGVALVVPEGRLGVLEDLVGQGRSLSLRPGDQVPAVFTERGVTTAADLPFETLDEELVAKRAVFTDVTAAAYQTRMRGLAYKARTVREETGANNLYLVLGHLAWQLDGRPLTSPLVLVPVRLVSSRGHLYRVELDETGASTPNYCLLEKLRQVHGLELPALADPATDEAGLDLPAVLDAVRRAVADAALPFRVVESAGLALLQFAKFRLWKDLDEHWQQLATNSLVRHLVETPTNEYADPVPPPPPPDLDELDARCPVGADASQLAAVAEAVAGRTFVLEGPPGTGKSQTITNLLTRAVADGQRVLFVAEKRAALAVVQSRLAAVGMGPFSLDLHDKGSRPTAVRAQIRATMDHAVTVDEQGLAVLRSDLDTSRGTLARYAVRLHEPDAAGLSYYSARTLALTLGDGPTLDVPTSLVAADPAPLATVREALRLLPDVAEAAAPTVDHPWGFSGSGADPGAVGPATDRVQAATLALPDGGLRPLLEAARTVEELGVVADVAAFVAEPHPGLERTTPVAMELPLAEIAEQATAAADSFFLGRGRRLKAVRARLEPGLAPGTEVDKGEVPALAAALLAAQRSIHDLAARLTALGVALPPGWNPLVPAQQVTGPSDPLRTWLRAGCPSASEERAPATELAGAWRTLAAAADADPHDVRRWAGATGLLERWRRAEPARATDPATAALGVRRWAALHARLDPLRAAGMTAAADRLLTGEVHHDDAAKALDRGVAVAARAERSAATGLDAFDPVAHTRAVSRFTTSLSGMRRELAGAVPAEVVAERGFRTGATSGLVGELAREVGRQRGGLGVRALMERYGDLVTRLLPITLVSPDSVARFFPVGSQRFDLVVFDEASQIRVADAIGAMGRSDAVVVVGDSKQLPPTSFGEVSLLEDDAPESSPEDAESILTEAVAARVPQRWLTWHYRSQDESLIAFSNRHYYDDRLSSFPSPVGQTTSAAERLASGRGISLVRVDGTFHRTAGRGTATGPLRTNPVEAGAIVADLRRRFDASPGVVPSVGVVTFNAQQRAHIEGLLRDADDPRLGLTLDEADGEGLFVKNLENVQGDERDVILFSTAFSVDERGVLPLNFGPLTRGGGERRLNVAITRARRQVVLYSSFDPEQLRVEETRSIGVRHLRAYLELARSGPAALGSTTVTQRRPDDRHRDEVAARLRERGLSVTTDVGLSEFRVDLELAAREDPGQPLVAVLLDGPGWAARRTVGDRDSLPVEVLDRLLGWPAVTRVWTPEWVAGPDAVTDRLVRLVEETRARASEPTAPPPAPVGPPPTSYATLAAPAPAAAGPEGLTGQTAHTPFVPTPRGPRSVLDSLPSPVASARVEAVLREVVAAEGPVHRERLARLVAACFDLSRLSSTRIDAVLACLPTELRPTYDAEPFAWPATLDPADWRGFRPGAARPLDEVCLRELGNAMVALCADTAGMAQAELWSETLTLFGGRRRTPVQVARLTAARDLALTRELLRVDAGGVHRVVT